MLDEIIVGRFNICGYFKADDGPEDEPDQPDDEIKNVSYIFPCGDQPDFNINCQGDDRITIMSANLSVIDGMCDDEIRGTPFDVKPISSMVQSECDGNQACTLSSYNLVGFFGFFVKQCT